MFYHVIILYPCKEKLFSSFIIVKFETYNCIRVTYVHQSARIILSEENSKIQDQTLIKLSFSSESNDIK